MRFNKKRKIVKREDIINFFNKMYPYELIIEYMDGKEVEWIDFWFEGNFDVTKEDIKQILEDNIRDTFYNIKVKGNKVYLRKYFNVEKVITVVKHIFKRRRKDEIQRV